MERVTGTNARDSEHAGGYTAECDMKSKTAMLLLMTLLAAACGRQQTNSDGNGPGNADGVGGKEDPATAPAADPSQPAPADD
jgi:hypothetical protein